MNLAAYERYLLQETGLPGSGASGPRPSSWGGDVPTGAPA